MDPSLPEFKDYMIKNCYSFGKFCIDNSVGTIEKPLEMLDESIRQTCLWSQTILSDDDPQHPPKETWFKYIKLWRDQCLKPHSGGAPGYTGKNFSALVCSKAVAAQVGVDFPKLEKCVANSFIENSLTKMLGNINTQSNTPIDINTHSNPHWAYENKILNTAMVSETYESIYIIPSMIINKLMYGGNMDPFLVTEAICDGFKTKPGTFPNF